MNTSSSVTRKKTTPKTPGKHQATLSSFFFSTKSKSSSSPEKSAPNESRNVCSEAKSSTDIELCKKRKHSPGSSDVNDNESNSKKKYTTHISDITVKCNNARQLTTHLVNNEAKGVWTEHYSKKVFGVQSCRSKTSTESINCEKNPVLVMEEDDDSSLKENSFEMTSSTWPDFGEETLMSDSPQKKGKISCCHVLKQKYSPKATSSEMKPSKRSSKVITDLTCTIEKFSSLNTESENVNYRINGESGIPQELLNSEFGAEEQIFKSSQRRIECDFQKVSGNQFTQNQTEKEDGKYSSSLEFKNTEKILKIIKVEEKDKKDIKLDPKKPTKETFSIDDDFLFDTFDESFKSDYDSEKMLNANAVTADFSDFFSEDWNADPEVKVDLSTLQRCQVSNTTRDQFQNLIVNVIHVESQIPVAVTLRGFWKDTRLQTGDIVNIQAKKQLNDWVVDNTSGFVVEQPDFLVSGTSVVGALFCARRGILSDRFKGIESVTDCKQGASVMVIGSLVHELFQKVLKEKIYTKPGITKLLKDLIKSHNTASMLYSAGMAMETCEKEMLPFVPKIFHFTERYIKGEKSKHADENFNGKINVIRDIEESLWVPQLGVKGKVDVTVEVNVNLKPRTMPLELKTGRPSFSLEHRGQVILYTMMMTVTGQDVEAGLLLYLRDNIMREIKVSHPEQRDLILLRNNLAYYLTRTPKLMKPVNSGVGEESNEDSMELPEPINHRACQNCPYSALCCAYLKNDKSFQPTDRHPLTSIIRELDNYLKPEHIKYVKKWVKMLQINEADEVQNQPLRNLWTIPPTQREKNGKCISNLKIIGKVFIECNRFRHTFTRVNSADFKVTSDLTKFGFNTMEYVIISTDTKINVCAGTVIELSKDTITVLLERNLVEKKPKDVFHIDPYVSQSMLIANLSNIGYLLDDNAVTERMRKIVIERAPATFLKKLDRSVAVVAEQVLKPLNKMQQRAVLKVVAANEYLLIKGMPGTGKTQTLVAIIELLVKMGKSVLLTAHTHSAVDNVLLKLIETNVDFVRLGSTNRINPKLLSKSEAMLTQECRTPESLDTAYNSKNVVCVTCLGANHPLLGRRIFDVCLVDESTQVLQSSLLRPLYSSSKFVLIGDPDQLPPVVKSNEARKLGMDQSLFERLDNENNTVTLTLQYRMNQRIMSVANQITYKGQLTIGADDIGMATLHIPDKSVLNSSKNWVKSALSTDLDDSVVVLHTGDTHNIFKDDISPENDNYRERKCSNLCEAAVILHLVTILMQAGVVAGQIGVIAPYREQVNLLRDIIEQDVEVNTVDQYQGRDKELILYSGTRSNYVRSVDAEKEFNILDDYRRLTVAITRAKHKLIIVGDIITLKQFVPFKKLFDQIRSKDLITLQNGCADFQWRELLSIVKC
ncbi:DNA replication ATP-dependent helicase/nuclease DNA2 isoform X1 [Neodiprion lecontei]|uniref:DNA replication ATP-dependent helicase/nuclease n=1 Tax=Neodiprion lecontei TaxID=441921 RepID=A0A6J0BTQ9_NEOLC|nr:DNA replication ATP-dependent helicase/nuclease DNA2 isoform X1 [Neodiprion lecontei]